MDDMCELTEVELDLVVGGAASTEVGPVCGFLGCYEFKRGSSYDSIDLAADILRSFG